MLLVNYEKKFVLFALAFEKVLFTVMRFEKGKLKETAEDCSVKFN